MAFTTLNCNLRLTANSALHIACMYIIINERSRARYTSCILHSTLPPSVCTRETSYTFRRLVARLVFLKFLIYAPSVRPAVSCPVRVLRTWVVGASFFCHQSEWSDAAVTSERNNNRDSAAPNNGFLLLVMKHHGERILYFIFLYINRVRGL